MSWHVHTETLVEYEQGRVNPAQVMAIEAHLATCARCRAEVPVDDAWLADGWAAVLDVVDSPRPSPLERLLHRLGMPEHRARLLAATPSLRWSWLAATAAVLAFAVFAAHVVDGTPGSAFALFLAVAPALPVLAVAAAYGPLVDPLHEISATTPMAGHRLLLWRASAVLTVAVAMGGVAAAFLPTPAGVLAVAWLLPALALSLGTLALSTVLPPHVAAGLLGAGWLAAVCVAVGIADRHQTMFGPAAQAGYLLAALAAATVLILRHRRLDPGAPR